MNETCRYAHRVSELRSVPCRQQSLCTEWQTCPYAHYYQNPLHFMIDRSTLASPNTSMGLSTSYDFARLEHDLLRVNEELGVLEKQTISMFQNEEDALDRDIKTLNARYDELAEQIQDDVADIDRLIKSLKAPKRVSWADSDDDSDDDNDNEQKSGNHRVKTQKRVSWANNV